MVYEVGSESVGKVVSLMSYGAFVMLDGGVQGMVHISEVSNRYVKDISDFLEVGQEIKVRIIGEGKNGHPSLSMICEEKQDNPPESKEERLERMLGAARKDFESKIKKKKKK